MFATCHHAAILCLQLWCDYSDTARKCGRNSQLVPSRSQCDAKTAVVVSPDSTATIGAVGLPTPTPTVTIAYCNSCGYAISNLANSTAVAACVSDLNTYWKSICALNPSRPHCGCLTASALTNATCVGLLRPVCMGASVEPICSVCTAAELQRTSPTGSAFQPSRACALALAAFADATAFSRPDSWAGQLQCDKDPFTPQCFDAYQSLCLPHRPAAVPIKCCALSDTACLLVAKNQVSSFCAASNIATLGFTPSLCQNNCGTSAWMSTPNCVSAYKLACAGYPMPFSRPGFCPLYPFFNPDGESKCVVSRELPASALKALDSKPTKAVCEFAANSYWQDVCSRSDRGAADLYKDSLAGAVAMGFGRQHACAMNCTLSSSCNVGCKEAMMSACVPPWLTFTELASSQSSSTICSAWRVSPYASCAGNMTLINGTCHSICPVGTVWTAGFCKPPPTRRQLTSCLPGTELSDDGTHCVLQCPEGSRRNGTDCISSTTGAVVCPDGELVVIELCSCCPS
jgi:hypothetical protein